MATPAPTELHFISRFQVMTATAPMPSSCRGEYRRVAVVEVDTDMLHELGQSRPSKIDDRAKGMVRVAEMWERCSVGKTARSAYARAMSEASEMAAELNSSYYTANPDQLEVDAARS
jgi:hypothetical protein